MTIDPKLWNTIDQLAVETQTAFMKPDPPMTPEEFKNLRLRLLGALCVALADGKDPCRERAYAALRHYAVYIELRETQTEAGTDLKDQKVAIQNFYREGLRALILVQDELIAVEPSTEDLRREGVLPVKSRPAGTASAFTER